MEFLDNDSDVMQIITDCMEGGWLPHWNLCTSSFYMWMKDPTTYKSLLLKDLLLDLKRIDLILEAIFNKRKEQLESNNSNTNENLKEKDLVSSVETLITQRERLEFIFHILQNNNSIELEKNIDFDFCTRELKKKKPEMQKYQIPESDPLLKKYKQRALQKVFS